MSAEKMFPILLQFRDFVAGNGFLAHVTLDGRALLVAEGDGDHWVYGVKPGAVAGGASEASTALSEFKTQYLSVLYDIASDTPTFEAFRVQVQAFFDQTDSDGEDWDRALEAVRKTNMSLDDLPTIKAEQVPLRLEITEVVQSMPALNELGFVSRAA
jgi:hypothetical protein